MFLSFRHIVPLLVCAKGEKELKVTLYLFSLEVPGGSDGPSGVLICSENYITYKNFGDQPDIRCPIPRRRVRSFFVIRDICEMNLIFVIPV